MRLKRQDYFKLLRAEAALSAFRLALDLMRHKDRANAERLVLARIAEKKKIVVEWKRLRAKEREAERQAAAEADYREANAVLLEENDQ